MLRVEKINVFYGDIRALWDVSLMVNDGEIVAFIGSNGAGKSTVMRTISGLLRPATGHVLFNNIHLEKLPPHKIVECGVSMVPEGRRIFPSMTVLENLEVGASTRKSRQAHRMNMEWVFTLFPVLKQRVKQIAGTLSGGEQQMLAIGRALMAEPALLLIDEMSLGLSPLVAQEIFHVIQEINKSKKLMVLLVEQDTDMALSVSHRGYIIENGRIILEGEAKKLACDPKIMEAYLGIKN